MANYKDDFFGPIRVPVLKAIDRKDVRVFLEKYRKYVVWVTERAWWLEGAEPQIMQLKLCINNKLLRTLARFEIKIPIKDLTESYSRSILPGF